MSPMIQKGDRIAKQFWGDIIAKLLHIEPDDS